MQSTTIPSAALNESAQFFYQLGLGSTWLAAYNSAMETVAKSNTKSPGAGTGDRAKANILRRTRNRISKFGQRILDCLPDEGMAKSKIAKVTRLTSENVQTGIKSLERAKMIAVKNGRYYKVTDPTGAVATRPSGGTRTRAATGAKAPSKKAAAILEAIRTLPPPVTSTEIQEYLAKQGDPIRSNHLGIALQRHRRAGRVEQRNDAWYLPAQAQEEFRQAG